MYILNSYYIILLKLEREHFPNNRKITDIKGELPINEDTNFLLLIRDTLTTWFEIVLIFLKRNNCCYKTSC